MSSPPPLSPNLSPQPPPKKRQKRQKREEYRSATTKSSTLLPPKKKFYRQRAHANPFSDHQLSYPAHPSHMDWAPYFPAYISTSVGNQDAEDIPYSGSGSGSSSSSSSSLNSWLQPRPRPLTKPITVADVGCGFGGLLVALAPLLPEELILGLEIRTQASQFVTDRIRALRAQHTHSSPTPASLSPPSPQPLPQSQTQSTPLQTPYQNIACLRSNAMKFLPNLFPRSSLTRLFLCFPDPHFKVRKHKARIISTTLVAEYAYVLRPGIGWLYFVTDVEDLWRWARGCFEGCEAGRRLFEEVGEEEREGDVGTRVMRGETEEGKKVLRNGGEMFVGIWKRREEEPWPEEEEEGDRKG